MITTLPYWFLIIIKNKEISNGTKRILNIFEYQHEDTMLRKTGGDIATS
jgi:hypothetical protein